MTSNFSPQRNTRTTTDAVHSRIDKSVKKSKALAVANAIGKNEELLKKIQRESVQVFVLDKNLCKHEENDMRQAILYHYPRITSEDHVNFLSQLLGMTQFLANTFSAAEVLQLKNGCFAIYPEGRFLVGVGHLDVDSYKLAVAHKDYLVNLITIEYGGLESLYDKMGHQRDKIVFQLSAFFQLHMETLGTSPPKKK